MRQPDTSALKSNPVAVQSDFLVEPYSLEDELRDQLEQLPSEEHVQKLVERLSKSRLKTVTEGLINDSVNAYRNQDMLEAVKALNSWIATLEEVTFESGRLQHIMYARKSRKRGSKSS